MNRAELLETLTVERFSPYQRTSPTAKVSSFARKNIQTDEILCAKRRRELIQNLDVPDQLREGA